MASSAGAGSTATGREVSIVVADASGVPIADALVRLFVDGSFVGEVQTQSGSLRPITLSIEDAGASVGVTVEVLGQPIRQALLDPNQHDVRFVYANVVRGFATVAPAALAPRAICPDGTSNRPCVICRSGDKKWRICV